MIYFENKEEAHPENKENIFSSGKREKMKVLIAVLAVVQIALLLFIAFKVNSQSNTITKVDIIKTKTGSVNTAAVAAVKGDSGTAGTAKAVNTTKIIDDDEIKGDKKAKVTIVEFSDYECPFCTKFYKDTFLQLDRDYIQTGKVNFVFRDFPLSFHQNAQKAAEAAECAGEQGKYYEMHNLLFEKGVSGGASTFKQYASDIGLDATKFNSCLDTGKMASEVQKDSQDGIALGVSGTPSFIINGKSLSGAQPYSVFKQIIEQELATS